MDFNVLPPQCKMGAAWVLGDRVAMPPHGGPRRADAPPPRCLPPQGGPAGRQATQTPTMLRSSAPRLLGAARAHWGCGRAESGGGPLAGWAVAAAQLSTRSGNTAANAGATDDWAASAGSDAQHAEEIVDVTQAAELAAIVASKVDCWVGTRTFIDVLVAAEGVWGLPWWVPP